MSGAPPRAAGSYLRFAGSVALWTAAAALAGAVPTRRWGGDGALAAMLAGCGISALGALAGGAALARPRGTPEEAPGRAIRAAAVRLAVTLALGLAAAASGRFAVAPLLIWMAVSYVLLLVLDTRYAVAASRDSTRS